MINITDADFACYSKIEIEDRKILLEKMIRKNYKFKWGCQATIRIADDPELMTLMRRAGCFAVFTGIESLEENDLIEMNKAERIKTGEKLIR